MSADTKTVENGTTEVPLLARIWLEDDVWNISAFDLPIVAYGERIEQARLNFEEAVQGHLKALSDLNRIDSAVALLRSLAAERGFYEERVKPHVLVESFSISAPQEQAA